MTAPARMCTKCGVRPPRSPAASVCAECFRLGSRAPVNPAAVRAAIEHDRLYPNHGRAKRADVATDRRMAHAVALAYPDGAPPPTGGSRSMAPANDDPRAAVVAETLARATRLRNGAVRHLNDAAVLRVASEVGEAFMLRTDAAGLAPEQALAVAARISYGLGVATYRMLARGEPGNPGDVDLDAFRAAYAALVDTGIEVLTQEAQEVQKTNAHGETIQ